MIRIYLVRHGETVWNAEGRIQGHLDVELSEKGKHQAVLLARRLADVPLDAVYSSDLSRAWMTAELVANTHGLTVTRTELLREAMLGEWQGHTGAELISKFPDLYALYKADSVTNRPPGGERLEDVIDRCARFLDQIRRDHQEGNLLLVGHGGSVRGVICAALSLPPSYYRHFSLDNVGLSTIEFNNGRWVLAGLNDICHLRDEESHGLQEV